MEKTEERALGKLQEAYALLGQRFTDEGGRGVSLADAIDHTGAAIRSLGGEPKEGVSAARRIVMHPTDPWVG